jgi:hypothetical protein
MKISGTLCCQSSSRLPKDITYLKTFQSLKRHDIKKSSNVKFLLGGFSKVSIV